MCTTALLLLRRRYFRGRLSQWYANVTRCTVPLEIQDVGQKFNMAVGKPEVLITRKLVEAFEKFQRLHPGFLGCLTDWNYRQCYSTSTDTGNWNSGAATGSSYICAVELGMWKIPAAILIFSRSPILMVGHICAKFPQSSIQPKKTQTSLFPCGWRPF